MKQRWFSKGILVGLAGCGLILLALLAPWLGLDNDAGWGTGKRLLLASGAGLALLAVILLRFGVRIHIWWQTTALAGWLSHLRDRYQKIPTGVFVLPAVLVSAAVYLWFLSAGSWFSFPEVKNSYNDLAAAFNAGQLALLTEPDPALVALENPYDPAQRDAVPFEWDLSYYLGRYYLYWGPVPALVLAPLKALFQDALPGQAGLLLGSIALVCLLGWLAALLRDRFLPRFPRALTGVFVLAAGINLPFMFLVSRPQVYETSILFGQVFLLLGMVGLVRAFLSECLQPGWFALAGLGWGLAVGSRYSLVGAVGVLTLFTLLYGVRKCPRRRAAALALLTPLGLVAGLLLAYNAARFGNPLETGFAYQLTIPHDPARVFSPAYLPANAALYWGYPLTWRDTFPFLHFQSFEVGQYFSGRALPATQQFDEFFAGLAGGVPLTGLVLLAALAPGRQAAMGKVRWLLTGFFSAAAVQWLLVGCYYYAAVRFSMDALPLTLLTGYIAAGLLFSVVRGKLLLHWLLVLAVFGVAGFTIFAGFLAGFDAPPQYFRITRPAQFEHIASQANLWLAETRLLPERIPGLPGVLLRWIFY